MGGTSLFYDNTCVHDINSIGDIRYHAEVMGDVEQGHAFFVL